MAQVRKRRVRRRRRRVSVSNLVAVLMLLVGLGMIAYPSVSNWWNEYHSKQAIAEYVEIIDGISPEEEEAMLKAASEYNEDLRDDLLRFNAEPDMDKRYWSLLNVGADGMIGYVRIDAIGVEIPVYHGTGDDVLNKAVGHVEGSSLPVGGEGTHAALSGHRGLTSAKLFTDLDRLHEGERFTMTVMHQVMWYEIDQIRIVEPADLSDLRILDDADELTLITCTPYGVNTHRLLVRGHRVEGDGSVAIPADGVLVPNYVAVIAVGVPMTLSWLVYMLVRNRSRMVRERQRARAVRELHRMARERFEDKE